MLSGPSSLRLTSAPSASRPTAYGIRATMKPRSQHAPSLASFYSRSFSPPPRSLDRLPTPIGMPMASSAWTRSISNGAARVVHADLDAAPDASFDPSTRTLFDQRMRSHPKRGADGFLPLLRTRKPNHRRRCFRLSPSPDQPSAVRRSSLTVIRRPYPFPRRKLGRS